MELKRPRTSTRTKLVLVACPVPADLANRRRGPCRYLASRCTASELDILGLEVQPYQRQLDSGPRDRNHMNEPQRKSAAQCHSHVEKTEKHPDVAGFGIRTRLFIRRRA